MRESVLRGVVRVLVVRVEEGGGYLLKLLGLLLYKIKRGVR
jgi:hypothetical protein